LLAANFPSIAYKPVAQYNILLRGQGVVDILPIAGVLLGFAGVFFVIGISRFRYE
jgi:hypothetical protein